MRSTLVHTNPLASVREDVKALAKSLPRDPINPFEYYPKHHNIVSWLVMFVGAFTLLPMRLLGIIIHHTIVYIWTWVVTIGADMSQPQPRWRRRLIQAGGRFGSWSLGVLLGHVYWTVNGKLADPEEAPILCLASHSGFGDFIPVSSAAFPSGISKEENNDIPVYGRIMMVSQSIAIKRETNDSRKQALIAMKERAANPSKWPQMIIFPEGTTSNRRSLLNFKIGAFAPGVPVQPIAIKYTPFLFDPAFVLGGPPGLLLFLMQLCQPIVPLEATYLPVYKPSPEEIADPQLYANNVRDVLAKELDVPTSSCGFEDLILAYSAQKKKFPWRSAVIGFCAIKEKTGFSLGVCERILERFSRMDTNKDGKVDARDMAAYLSLPYSNLLQDVFNVFTCDETGFIDFRQYVIGTAVLSKRLSSTDTGLDHLFSQLAGKDSTDSHARVAPARLQSQLQALMREQSDPSLHWDRLLRSLDCNRDGYISFEDLREFVDSRPEFGLILEASIHQSAASA